jgi:glycosyltransferase involved in cell wall biosynthesis
MNVKLEKSKDISIVIPLFNEEDSLRELHTWIQSVMIKQHYAYEIIFIDDGSKDGSWAVIEELNKQDACVKGIKFQRNYGKSAALQKGFELAEGNVVFTMDADLQDSPEEIPAMYAMIIDEDYDLVSGWKKKRYDPISKTIPTKLYNWAARRLTGIYLHDFNCGLKA